jgi:hypothetical protein
MVATDSNTHKWSNWEAVFSTLSVRQLRDVTTQELLGELFSVLSVPRCYKHEKSEGKGKTIRVIDHGGA